MAVSRQRSKMKAASKYSSLNFIFTGGGLVNARALMLVPTVSNYAVNIYLLGVGLFLIVVALAISCYVLKCIARAYDAACNRLEYRLRIRRGRLRSLAHLQRHARRPRHVSASHPSSAAVNAASNSRATVLPYKSRRTVDAREALRRSGHQGDDRPTLPRGA